MGAQIESIESCRKEKICIKNINSRKTYRTRIRKENNNNIPFTSNYLNRNIPNNLNVNRVLTSGINQIGISNIQRGINVATPINYMGLNNIKNINNISIDNNINRLSIQNSNLNQTSSDINNFRPNPQDQILRSNTRGLMNNLNLTSNSDLNPSLNNQIGRLVNNNLQSGSLTNNNQIGRSNTQNGLLINNLNSTLNNLNLNNNQIGRSNVQNGLLVNNSNITSNNNSNQNGLLINNLNNNQIGRSNIQNGLVNNLNTGSNNIQNGLVNNLNTNSNNIQNGLVNNLNTSLNNIQIGRLNQNLVINNDQTGTINSQINIQRGLSTITSQNTACPTCPLTTN